MSKEFESEVEVKMHELLSSLAAQGERREVLLPHGGNIVSFHNPEGIEVAPFLDPEHLPKVTQFSTIMLSTAFEGLKHGSDTNPKDVVRLVRNPNPESLATIAQIANRGNSPYELNDTGRELRLQYLGAMVSATHELFRERPIESSDVVVPVVRAGGNVFNAWTGLDAVGTVLPAEAKRLRFRGLSSVLGSGCTLSSKHMEAFSNSHVRLFEGVVASGSTAIVFALETINRGIRVRSLDTDAVIVNLEGARMIQDFSIALGLNSRSRILPMEVRGVYAGGVLDDNWYLRFGENDRLLQYLPQDLQSIFVGQLVMGDGGDLTSNL